MYVDYLDRISPLQNYEVIIHSPAKLTKRTILEVELEVLASYDA